MGWRRIVDTAGSLSESDAVLAACDPDRGAHCAEPDQHHCPGSGLRDGGRLKCELAETSVVKDSHRYIAALPEVYHRISVINETYDKTSYSERQFFKRGVGAITKVYWSRKRA